MDSAVLIILISLLLLNILVSVYLFKRDDLESFQKYAQSIIVWLIPFVGAISLWLFHRSQDENVTRDKPEFGGSKSQTQHTD